MEIPEHLRYLKSHEWARLDGAEVAVGVSEYAVEALNRDIVYVELPTVGATVKQGEPFGVIEAVKAVYDLYSPVTGRVVACNEGLADDASAVGRSPFDEGWMIRVEAEDPRELDKLLTASQYREGLETEETEH